jgi:hypothetical protein
MRSFRTLAMVAVSVAVSFAGAARAGAPQPETRQGGYPHVCKGGPNRGLACTVPNQDVDCPGSECTLETVTGGIKGTLTLIAHDSVIDWSTDQAANRALTAMLEVRAPDGSQQMLAATYQDLAEPTNPPRAPNDVVAIDMDEAALEDLSAAASGLLFARPDSTMTAQLQSLFGTTGIPILVTVTDRRVQSADHTADGLATVVRLKVRIQFVAAP